MKLHGFRPATEVHGDIQSLGPGVCQSGYFNLAQCCFCKFITIKWFLYLFFKGCFREGEVNAVSEESSESHSQHSKMLPIESRREMFKNRSQWRNKEFWILFVLGKVHLKSLSILAVRFLWDATVYLLIRQHSFSWNYVYVCIFWGVQFNLCLHQLFKTRV